MRLLVKAVEGLVKHHHEAHGRRPCLEPRHLRAGTANGGELELIGPHEHLVSRYDGYCHTPQGIERHCQSDCMRNGLETHSGSPIGNTHGEAVWCSRSFTEPVPAAARRAAELASRASTTRARSMMIASIPTRMTLAQRGRTGLRLD